MTTANIAAEMTKSFRRETGKRQGEAYQEDGAWWVIDADGHQWCLVADEDGERWERFTDDDDWYVLEVRREKRATRRAA